MAKMHFKTAELREAMIIFLKVLKVVSPVSGVGMISTLCLFMSGVYYIYLLPYQWNTLSLPMFFLNICIAHWILVNTLYNYILAIIIHPGKSKGKGPSKCRTCRTSRPERAHHCRQCGFCVLMMDHHCLWINNCVGYYNYGYFMRACIFVWVGACYGSLALFAEVNAYTQSTSVMFFSEDLPNICVVAFCICFAIAVAFTILNMWYFSLIKSGMTSIEYKQLQGWKGTTRSPYDRGLKTNLAFALGVRGDCWSRLLRPSYYIPSNFWTTVDLEDVQTEF